MAHSRALQRKGLTLIELVMVLIILTALAALVVPIIDSIRRTSDKATASFVMEQLVENVGLYRTLTGVYGGGFDTCLDETGLAAAANLSSKVESKCDIMQLTGNEGDKLDDLIPTVMLHDPAGPIYRNWPGNSGNTRVACGGSGGQSSFWTITDAMMIESIYPGATTNAAGTFPNVAEAGLGAGQIALGSGPGGLKTARLIILGVGPSYDGVGKTLVTAPGYLGIDGTKYYNRFYCIFACYDGFTVDKRPQLKGALDSTMDFLNQEIIEVLENSME
ncbi:MAG: prepilin-type N-terminal cleavage/methylation domain-containing protein [Planctomycetota bacterium]|nr:prepilin-type N-terminal cleavage/methylation domain-containing protein [Planctomycetota bacterium]